MRFIQESEWENKGCHFELLGNFIKILHDLIHCASLIWFARGGRIYIQCLFDYLQWLFQHYINHFIPQHLESQHQVCKRVLWVVAAAAVRLICSSPTALYHPTVSVCSAYTPPLCPASTVWLEQRLRVVNIYINIGQKQAVTLALPLG